MIHMLDGPGVAVVQVAGSDFDVSVFLRQDRHWQPIAGLKKKKE